jgi:hypothetical protein
MWPAMQKVLEEKREDRHLRPFENWLETISDNIQNLLINFAVADKGKRIWMGKSKRHKA